MIGTHDLQPLLIEYEGKQNKWKQKLLRLCMSQRNRNAFIQCIGKKNDIFDNEQLLYKFKLNFALAQADQCLRQSSKSFDVQMCQQNLRDDVTSYHEYFKQRMKQEFQ